MQNINKQIEENKSLRAENDALKAENNKVKSEERRILNDGVETPHEEGCAWAA